MRTLSVCMIVRDERHNLGLSLAPLMPHVSEAVVVDTGSKDGTPEAAAALGARVFHFTWQDNFSLARNFSLAQAQGDWIIWLDADNRLSGEDAATLVPLVQRTDDAIMWATEVVEPGGGRLLQKRIFPRRQDIFFRYRVHEQLCHPPELEQVVTGISIRHWGYGDRRLRRAKGQRNLALLLMELEERPGDFYVHYQLGRHYFLSGDTAKAGQHLQRAQGPDAARDNQEIYRHARLLAALTRARQAEGAEARRELESLTGEFPAYGLAWYHLGLSQFQTGKYEAASGSLERFLTSGPGHLFLDQPEERLRLTALLTRAQTLRKLGRLAEAGQVLNLAQEEYPQEARVWLETAAWAREQGNRAGLQRALAICLALRPDSQAAGKLWQETAADHEPVGAQSPHPQGA